MGRASKWLVTVLVGVLCTTAAPTDAFAAITATGDVHPADPATWTSSTDAYVGKTGVGSVTVDGNSDVVLFWGYVGYSSGSTGVVTVDGAGSTWANDSELNVGHDGNGTLSIANGGAVVGNIFTNIGYESGSTGGVTVNGAGSTLTSLGLYVGLYGNGTLNITNGGAVSSSGAHIGSEPGSTGEVTVDGAGSTFTNESGLHVGLYGSGTLNIANGGAVTAGSSVRIYAGAQLRTGDASITAADLLIEGNWIIDGSEQTTRVDGNLSFAGAGALDLGRNRIVVDYTGSGVSPIAGVEPWIAGGQIYSSIIDPNKDVGYYDNVLTDKVRIAVTWKGDVDCDFDVDLDDLTIMGTFYNVITDGTAKWQHGDVNKDGNVDLDDLTLLGAFYNATPSVAGGGPLPIPEPACAVVLLVGALGMVVRRRGKRGH